MVDVSLKMAHFPILILYSERLKNTGASLPVGHTNGGDGPGCFNVDGAYIPIFSLLEKLQLLSLCW